MNSSDFDKIINDSILRSIQRSADETNEYLEKKIEEEDKIKKLDIRLKKWYNQPIIGFIIALLSFSFALYQGYKNKEIKQKFVDLKSRIDSLENEIYQLNKKYETKFNKKYILNIPVDSTKSK